MEKHVQFVGFTLTELLVALVIMSFIAIFTIPKVLSVTQDNRDADFKRRGKQAAAVIQAAYSLYRQNHRVTANTGPADLTPYINYVGVDTVSMVDREQTKDTKQCSGGGSDNCLHLPNGAMLHYGPDFTFGDVAATNAIFFFVDPDARVTDGTTNGPGKSIQFFIYYNGKLKTRGTIDPFTQYKKAGVPFNSNPKPQMDPPWFRWN